MTYAPNVRTLLDLSTGHVPGDVAGAAQAEDGKIECGPHRVQEHEYGWVVFLAGEREDTDEQEPGWFRPIGELARACECMLVVFDRDAEESALLPTYDW